MKKLLPIILILIGVGGGIGAGVMLRPAPEEHAEAPQAPGCDPAQDLHCGEDAGHAMVADVHAVPDPTVVYEYVSLPKQFVIPLISKDRVSALVVLTISIETAEGTSAALLERQPRLRDSFLQVLFTHANSGGFDGAFTTGQSMTDLRGSLLQVARRIVGDSVNSVLIEEIVKQQM